MEEVTLFLQENVWYVTGFILIGEWLLGENTKIEANSSIKAIFNTIVKVFELLGFNKEK